MKKHVKTEDADYSYTKIKSLPIDPELMALKPFITPTKGFSYDEVLSMIQSVINKAKNNGR